MSHPPATPFDDGRALSGADGGLSGPESTISGSDGPLSGPHRAMSGPDGSLSAQGGALSDEGLASTRLPDNFSLVQTWVINTARQLSELRTGIMRALSPDAQVAAAELGPIPHSMVLVASELATNALKHGIPPTIVRLFVAKQNYLLDVADHDISTVPYLAGDRAPGHGGFGLQIARRLAIDVGWYTTETTKHVWATFPARVPD